VISPNTTFSYKSFDRRRKIDRTTSFFPLAYINDIIIAVFSGPETFNQNPEVALILLVDKFRRFFPNNGIKNFQLLSREELITYVSDLRDFYAVVFSYSSQDASFDPFLLHVYKTSRFI
jgi:hypothetical protein